MIYKDFKGLKLSLLGFGTMRLPLLEDKKTIDEEHFKKMVHYGVENGINYYDTAWPYHNSLSEIVTGKVLKDFKRDSFYLATTYPGHQISAAYDPAAVFEKQLEKCGVDHFDFYLLHNVYEKSIDVYEDERWGIIDYFIRQKKAGRIRHLGFSSHGQYKFLEDFLNKWGKEMEFCQIQLNSLDWTLQEGSRKYELLKEAGLPVWVMEPLRGGKLAAYDDESTKKLLALRPDRSMASWSLSFLQRLDGVGMILSGMSDMSQMIDNISTFEKDIRLTDEETDALMEVMEGLKDSVPCTACRYCCKGCPAQIDIPRVIALYNEARVAHSMNLRMTVDSMKEGSRPQDCIACGNCVKICPQNINIPEVMKDFTSQLAKMPDWEQICREREAAAKML